MNCQDILLTLDDADLSRLSQAQQARIQAHLAGCADCARVWQAQAKLLDVAAPPMRARLAARCQNLALAPANRMPRRRIGRPAVFAMLALAGLAAAAFVAMQSRDAPQDVAGPGPAPPDTAIVATVPGEPVEPDAALAETPAPTVAAEPVVANDSRNNATRPTVAGYTVAVSPLQQQALDPEAIRDTEQAYAALLQRLRELPGLRLAELTQEEMDALGEPDAPAGFVPRNFTALTPEPVVAATPGNSLPADLPLALRQRIDEITGRGGASYGSSAGQGAVSVAPTPGFSGFSMDYDYASGSEKDATPMPLPYDYALLVTGAGRSGAWGLTIRIRSATQAQRLTLNGNRMAFAEGMIDQLVGQLRDALLPPDPAWIAGIEAVLLDASRSGNERVSALRRLVGVLPRSGTPRLSANAIDGVLALGATARDPQVRVAVWNILQPMQDERLLQALGNALLQDPDERVRAAALSALDAYANDTARLLLASAARDDPSVNIRSNARWASLDEAGRRALVAASLLDRQLDPEQRLEPLEMAVMRRSGGSGVAWLEPILDASVAAAIDDLFADLDEPARRTHLLSLLVTSRAAALTPVLISRMNYDADGQVRGGAALGLRPRIEEPGVRQALENTAANDPSETVRQRARAVLEMPPLEQ